MSWPERLVTHRLVLRPPRLDDAASIFAEYGQDPEVTRYLPWAPHKTIDDTLAFLPHCLDGWTTGREMTWGITFPGEDRIVGMIAIRPNGHKADIGFVLARRFWGTGMMVEAGTAVANLAFQQADLFRLWAVCDIDNRQSVRVLEKLGMQREGVLRNWILHPNVSAEPRHALVYARVRPT